MSKSPSGMRLTRFLRPSTAVFPRRHSTRHKSRKNSSPWEKSRSSHDSSSGFMSPKSSPCGPFQSALKALSFRYTPKFNDWIGRRWIKVSRLTYCFLTEIGGHQTNRHTVLIDPRERQVRLNATVTYQVWPNYLLKRWAPTSSCEGFLQDLEIKDNNNK